MNKLTSFEDMLVQNFDSPTDSLTGVKCRATSVTNKLASLKATLVRNYHRLTHRGKV